MAGCLRIMERYGKIGGGCGERIGRAGSVIFYDELNKEGDLPGPEIGIGPDAAGIFFYNFIFVVVSMHFFKFHAGNLAAGRIGSDFRIGAGEGAVASYRPPIPFMCSVKNGDIFQSIPPRGSNPRISLKICQFPHFQCHP